MGYRLKPGQPAFDVVDGEYVGLSFVHGKIYPAVPPEYLSRFDKVEKPQPKKAASDPVEKPENADKKATAKSSGGKS